MEQTIEFVGIKDNYVTLTPGEAFRLFPFGKIYKGGKSHEITPEYAGKIHLPHFKAPIKLGSHEDVTPAGGFITALEIRDDGLYAVPEWNDAGRKAIQDGAFRFNSPEIIWEGGLENPTDGGIIHAPLIVGTALLHTPHLGEAAAMYSVQTIDKENIMENFSVPETFWDKFTAFIDAKIKGIKPEKVEVIPEDYEAAKVQRDEYKIKLDAIEKESQHKALVEKYESELKETKADPTLAELLAGIPEDTSAAIMKQFRALSEQINESALTQEKGTSGEGVQDPKAQFNALVVKKSAESKINYNAAFEVVKVENADLFVQAFKK